MRRKVETTRLRQYDKWARLPGTALPIETGCG